MFYDMRGMISSKRISRILESRVFSCGHIAACVTCRRYWQVTLLCSRYFVQNACAYLRRRRSGGRVKGWRLRLRRGSLFTLCFLLRVPQCYHHILVSIPCHLEPYVRFSLIRLSDNLLPGACTVPVPIPFICFPHQACIFPFSCLALPA